MKNASELSSNEIEALNVIIEELQSGNCATVGPEAFVAAIARVAKVAFRAARVATPYIADAAEITAAAGLTAAALVESKIKAVTDLCESLGHNMDLDNLLKIRKEISNS